MKSLAIHLLRPLLSSFRWIATSVKVQDERLVEFIALKEEWRYNSPMQTIKTDFLVIGSGLAGLAFALKVADLGEVLILTKAQAPSTNTSMAQGGIAAVTSHDDTFDSHIRDTLVAGAGLCKEDVVRNFVEQAPERIDDLIKWGVRFADDLNREGGHSARRVLHFEDQTGREIHRGLLEKVTSTPNIKIWEKHFGIDLIVNKQIDPLDMNATACVGAYVLDSTTNEVKAVLAKYVILATGGAGKVYLYTSNWSGATGDGIAMAYRAGARVANLEFMQFHPTCLFHPEARNFLISEAVRGEGGELVNAAGEAFMKKYHPMGSLAPRDIVARSIDTEMKKSGVACVYLDITHHSSDYLKSHFPAIYQRCLEYGFDMAKDKIPVVPAAHYLCGGVLTDVDGKTDLPSLFALGETACTGLHGANRLASNSLLECLTSSHNCSEIIRKEYKNAKPVAGEAPLWISPAHSSDEDELIVITHMWEEIRNLMWNYVGIVRSNKRLERAQHRLKNILDEVRDYYSIYKMRSDILELRNIAIVADLSVECALKRKESRGIHSSLDYKVTNPEATDTIVFRGRV